MHGDLQTDVGYRYSIATLVFFITYTIFQPPATIVTRKIGPRNFLPTICVAWGVVMVCVIPQRSHIQQADRLDRVRFHQRLDRPHSTAPAPGILRSRLLSR